LDDVERNKKKLELEEMEKFIAEEKRKLDELPKTIPVEPQDISFNQPIMPSLPLPRYQPQPQALQPKQESFSMTQVAYEVMRELTSKRIMSVVGVASGFVVLLLDSFSKTFGMIGVIGIASYFIIEAWRTTNRMVYLKRNYGV
jgi:hypothetical protein